MSSSGCRRATSARPGGPIPAFRRAAALHAALTTRLSTRVLIGEQDGALIVLVAEGQGRRAMLAIALTELTNHVDEEPIGGRAAPRRLPIVLGPAVHAVKDYPLAWHTVRSAAALADDRSTTGIVDLDELGVAALLLEAGTPEGLRHLADRRLGPLEAYDRARGASLVETLRTWLRAGCSTAATARAMHLHAHTVSYRLRRVADLCGLDPQHADGVFELRVAVLVRDVQHATGPDMLRS